MKRLLLIVFFITMAGLTGCRTLDGPGAAAGAGTYPEKATPDPVDTVLLTETDSSKAGGFAIRRTPFSNIPVSTPMQTALDLKQDAATAATDAELAAAVSIDASGFNGNLSTTDDTIQKVAQKVDDLAISGDGTIVADGTDPTKAAAAVTADTMAATGLTGTIDDARIPSTIARDTEVTSAVSGKFDTPTGTTAQVVLGDGSLGALPSGSTITADGTDPTKAATAVTADTMAATGLTGTIDDARIPPGVTRDSELATATVATAGELSPTKSSGVAGYSYLFEADTTNTLTSGFQGPDDLTLNISYKLPNSVGSAGQVLALGTAVPDTTLPDGRTGTIVPLVNADQTGAASNLDTTNFAASALVDASEALTQGATDLMVPTWGAMLVKLNDLLVSGNPSIAITTPASDGTWVDSLTYTSFAGTAFDLQGISEIAWKLESGGTYATTGVTGTTSWGVDSITLSEGANELYARVTDTSASTAEANITLNADTTDPVIVASADSTHDGTDTVTSSCTLTETNPASPAVTATVTGATPASPTVTLDSGTTYVTEALTPTGTDDIVVTFAATDLAGNAATGTDLVQEFAHSGGVSYLIDEDFEGTGLPTSWSVVSGTWDYDYTTSPAPLSGSESCTSDARNYQRLKSPDFTATATVYCSFEFSAVGTIDDANQDAIFTVRTSSNNIGSILLINGTLRLDVGGYRSRTAITASEKTYVWVDAVESGSDTEWSVYVSTTATKPETPEGTYTQTGVVSNFTNLYLRNEAGGTTSVRPIFDSVKVASEAF